MFITLLSSLRWYESTLFPAVFVSVHSSELYRKILSTHALNILIFVLMLSLLLLKMGWKFSHCVVSQLFSPFDVFDCDE